MNDPLSICVAQGAAIIKCLECPQLQFMSFDELHLHLMYTHNIDLNKQNYDSFEHTNSSYIWGIDVIHWQVLFV